MNKRLVVALLVMIGLIGCLAWVKVRQIQAGIAQGQAFVPPPEAVTTVTATKEAWLPSLSSLGTVAPVQGVTVSADLPGVIEHLAIESGESVRKGAVLIRLDSRQEQAQLRSAEARHELAHSNLVRMQGLREKRVSSQAELDSARAEADQAEAAVGEINAAIARKTVRAPFSGTLGIRQVNLGQYLHSGNPIVTLQSTGAVNIDFGLPQQALPYVAVGGEVRVTTDGTPPVVKSGRISAIDAVVAETTRNATIRAVVDNVDGSLRPGMYVTVAAKLAPGEPVITLPITAILYAPYGDSVFVVAEMKAPDGKAYRGARQQFVKLGQPRGDQIAVLSGVELGDEVVTSGVFKLRNGGAVVVDNRVQPGNNPEPKPEDN